MLKMDRDQLSAQENPMDQNQEKVGTIPSI